MLIQLNEARQNAEAAHRSAAVQTIATIDLALGDAFAHLDQVDRAFGMWDRCLSSGTPASVMELGGAPLVLGQRHAVAVGAKFLHHRTQAGVADVSCAIMVLRVEFLF